MQRDHYLKNGTTFLYLLVFLTGHAQVNLKSSKNELDSLRALSKNPVISDTISLKTLEDIATYFQKVNFDSAEIYAQAIVTKARSKDLKKQEVIGLQSLALTMLFKKDFSRAFRYNKESKTISEKIGYEKGKNNALINLGTIYRMISNYPVALQYYFEVLKNLESGRGDKKMECLCHFYIGVTYSKLKDYEKSGLHFESSLKLADEMKIDEYRAGALVNLYFVTERNSNDIEKSLNYLNRAMEIYERNNNVIGKSTVLQNLGYICFRQKDYCTALKYGQRSLELREKMKDENGTKNSHQLLSLIYRATGRYDKAIESDMITLRLAEKLKEIGDLAEANEHLSLCYKDLSDFKKALFYANEHARWKDSLFSFQKFTKINSMEMAYAIEKEQVKIDQLEKENLLKTEIAEQQKWKIRYLILSVVLLSASGGLLFMRFRQKSAYAVEQTKKNRIIENQNNEIRNKNDVLESVNRELHEKAFKSQMNPHFIFNSLNSIQFLILQKNSEDAFVYLSKFSTLLRKILDYSNQSRIDVKEEMEMLQLYLQLEALRFEDGLKYTIEADESLRKRNVIPPMMVQPIVENAIAHGLLHKKGERTLLVKFIKDDNRVLCSVTDNGIGREASSKIRSRNGGIFKSWGMKITEQRIAVQNNLMRENSSCLVKDLIDENGNPSGTCVTLTFEDVNTGDHS
jgi:tetratricopeptide (TPR) repeat protein